MQKPVYFAIFTDNIRSYLLWSPVIGDRRKRRAYDARKEVCEVQGVSRRDDRNKGKANAKKQGEIGEALIRRGIGEIKRWDRNEK